ncbi:3,4-dihydroxy-2-butanone-4-phosphate synthase [Desulfobacter hydrogenophilus]|uniref:3,4-dihydroxy-2-butanone 4-phosphate synthase n=1 Tax=Desulfobacter hydrogenophilus TaxID=2291 RepID=A0A328FD26_9BACT|nr:3,4-dihydroxy-2-butanone-4-phosphate synthase [Desulfobacter hydrogenophilus]NDY72099.1 3,4-dihydroxy-2-butanone-4-phosphate synthase [Desulfobacter hydrogenophilus]QBH14824.1 3,4-dihydroxy-2-butanone-4-phosphate synthase [Desulfobacter hydrogenophilus]RAM01332.1 3,4-dihydroxy-2-butanone-4-phosphate synthase [Desulfobacter hydrogenophilus]
MNQNPLKQFGNSQQRLQAGLEALRRGSGVLVADDENRENEVDLIFGAHSLKVDQMAMLIRECSGIVCLCLPQSKVANLNLFPMVKNNTSQYQTAFTVSIEAANGVTTGVSAQDRLTTIQAAIDDDAAPEDLNCPGHIFPLQAKPGGVLERAGHTEATVDLMGLAGLPPYGVLCELTNPDGTMARLPKAAQFAMVNGFTMLTVQDIINYKRGVQSVKAS